MRRKPMRRAAMRRGPLRALAVALVALALIGTACSGGDDDDGNAGGGSTEDPGDCVPVDMAVSSEKIALLSDLADEFNDSDASNLGRGDDNVVEVYVRYLRTSLEAHGPRLLQTVRGRGYALRREEDPA